jgi:hypothetical protein
LSSDRFRREVLSWFDERGDRYLTTDERVDIEGHRAEIEKQRADVAQKQVELLLAKLRSLGISEE